MGIKNFDRANRTSKINAPSFPVSRVAAPTAGHFIAGYKLRLAETKYSLRGVYKETLYR